MAANPPAGQGGGTNTFRARARLQFSIWELGFGLEFLNFLYLAIAPLTKMQA